jgi:hypothetical protein
MDHWRLLCHQLAEQSATVSIKQKSTFSLEGITERQHLVKHATETPYIGLLVVLAIFPDLRSHDEGSANLGLGEVESLAHEFGDAEVSDFHLVAGSDEDVVGLEITVQDLFVVDIL